MKNFTKEDLKRLMDIEADVCISIYMPTDPTAAATDEQRIRFKNLLRDAENGAQRRGIDAKALDDMIGRARQLLENDFFWRHQSSGLAVFMAPEVFLFYRLPIGFEELVSVANRFAVKPLVPLLTADKRFYILALSQSAVRLFDCTPYSVMEIDLVDVPDGIAETLQYDSKQYQLQFHTGAAGGGGRRPAVYHGHGVGTDESKNEILRYFQDVDRGLSKILSDGDTPLVLAGVDYLLPIFRKATSHRGVMPEAVSGNPDELSAEALHQKALGIVRPELDRSRREAAARYREAAGKGRTAAGVLAVVPATVNGQVDTLFVALDEQRWGEFDRTGNQARITDAKDSKAIDLLDLAARETILNGGRVFAVNLEEMPEADTSAAAILRY